MVDSYCMQLHSRATLWWSSYQTRKNEILSTYWRETQILLAWKPLKNFMCLKVFNKVDHRSSLYHGRYFFSDALKWWMVSLSVLPSEDNDFFLLLFTWSIKCLSCTSSSLKSLLWRWAFNLVKNSFCLLMSVAKIKEPSCCSISCLHPQEWKRKHTHKSNPFEEGDWLILSSSGGLYSHFCLWFCLLHRIPVLAAREWFFHPPSFLSLDGMYAKDWTERLKPWVKRVVAVYTFPWFLWVGRSKANEKCML